MARSRRVEQFEVVVGDEVLVVTSLPADAAGLSDARLSVLTAAERQIAVDVGAGLSNQAIAKKRKRSVRTIANQLASIYRKLEITSRAELAIVIMTALDSQS